MRFYHLEIVFLKIARNFVYFLKDLLHCLTLVIKRFHMVLLHEDITQPEQKNPNTVAVVGHPNPTHCPVSQWGDTKMYRVGDTERHRGGTHKCTSLTDKQSNRLIDFTKDVHIEAVPTYNLGHHN